MGRAAADPGCDGTRNRGELRAAALGRRAADAFACEPWWLRGVTWRLVGCVGALAALQASWVGITVVVPELRAQGGALPVALLEFATSLIVALAVLLCAALLVNWPGRSVPLPVRLAAAVLVGTLVPFALLVRYLVPPQDWAEAFVFFWRRAVVLWSILAAAWYFARRAATAEDALRVDEIGRRQLATGMLEARLAVLQAQIEPHFLFNTLAHVRRLYRTDPLLGRRMLDSLRAYLRMALPRMRGGPSTFAHELDLVRAYLEVQQVRMGGRLAVAVDIADPALLAQPYPPMMLVSLVENAVKHGLDPLPSGGEIAIAARIRDDVLEVCVLDTGCGMGDKIGSGVGLANVRQRLAACYGVRASLTLKGILPHGVSATIRTPTASSIDHASARARA